MLQSLITLRPRRKALLGSSAGESDLVPVLQKMQNPAREETLLLFDLGEVEDINGSYLRATFLWAVKCGQADIRSENPAPGNERVPVRPYPLFPVFTNCSQKVAEEIAEFVYPRDLCALVVKSGKPPNIEKANVIGPLDRFLSDTLSLLTRLGAGTAQELSESSTDNISANGWSNRLMDLYLLRLVHRERSGKYWIYKTLTREHELWALIS